ncbi:unnamed protein product [Somion occarium]|uniref:BTB domain-containing protein n=1 Tax=Somion occarium TaxID=3059160 RepID=A0ABP1E1H8_9APHY
MALNSGCTFPPAELQQALACSILNGDFVDTAYHVYSMRLLSGKVGKPRVVYGNSCILNATDYFKRQLSEKFSTGDEVPPETNEYDYDSDSDLEDEEETGSLSDESIEILPTGSSGSNSKGRQETNAAWTIQPTPQATKYSILIPDCAATTWQALLFYIYTGEIRFAPLRSQGEDVRAQARTQHKDTKLEEPPLCSPKSMYRLADKYGFEDLKQRAANDIQSKLTPGGILDEVFSKFSSKYPEVLQAQLDFLHMSGLKSSDFTPLLEAKLNEIIHPDHLHTANVLKYLLQNNSETMKPMKASTSGKGKVSPRSTAIHGTTRPGGRGFQRGYGRGFYGPVLPSGTHSPLSWGPSVSGNPFEDDDS